MNPMQAASAIDGRRRNLDAYDHHDEPFLDDPPRPYTVFYPAPGTPTGRRLDGQADWQSVIGRILCANNNALGAVKVAQDVVDLFDGWELDGDLVTCSCGPVLADPDMQAGYRWSVTVEIRHDLTR